MRALDRFLQRWRIGKALPFIPAGARVLDVGCFQGELFERLGDDLGFGLGLDPELLDAIDEKRYRLEPGLFPEAVPSDSSFDVITMLAVLEHIPEDQLPVVAGACEELLVPGGCLILTVPGPAVDHVLAALRFLRLVDGMSLDEHHGFDPRRTPAIFTPHGLELDRARRFQLGLNHLFVLRRPVAG